MQNKSFGKNILHGIRGRLGKMMKNPYARVNLGLLRKLYYKHLTPGKVRIHPLFGKEIRYVSATELLHGLTEIFVDEIYRQPFPPRPFIIDCGANIGLSVIYLKRLSPDAELIAFEPDKQNHALLQQNVERFGLTGVLLKNEAVWIREEMMSFSGGGSTSSKLVTAGSSGEKVKAIRLKDQLTRPVDFLKIDIEGAEYDVLKDIREKLSLVRTLFLEYHGSFEQNNELNEIFSILTGQGFRYYIKEAAAVYPTPFFRSAKKPVYDVQLNIFAFRS